jgi:Pvc16 N-terminal domain
MSNSLAIAATTATLRNLLLSKVRIFDTELADLDVTTRAPDVARKGITVSSLNVFLYQTIVNAAWRNMDMPRQVRPGETGSPPLALNLHYLVTAYGRDDTDGNALSHRVLGGAMSVLHDHSVLGAQEIANALPNNDLAEQIERVRITPLPLSIEEMSKLWTTFQTNYRISAAYEATVILIDSRNPVKSALPVLRRGQEDRGVFAVATGTPNLKEIRLPASQSAARLGEDVAIRGDNLSVTDTLIRFKSLIPSLPGDPPPPQVELAPTAGVNADELMVQLPPRTSDADAFGRWVPGFYTISSVVKQSGVPPVVSNEIAFALAPTITLTPNSTTVATVNVGDTLSLTCAPRVRSGQRILVLFGDMQLAPKTVTNPSPGSPTFKETPSTITFDIPPVPSGTYLVRLRVDGVDSIPVVLSGTPPIPTFDPVQQVKL